MRCNRLPRRLTVEFAISLRARPLHSGTFATIKKAELDSSCICQPPHNPVQCINFSHQMTFSKTTYCRIAGHSADIGLVHRHQSRFDAHTGSGHGGLDAGMASTNHDYVVMFHVKLYFPMQNELKISSR